MDNLLKYGIFNTLLFFMLSLKLSSAQDLQVKIVETSATGNRMTEVFPIKEAALSEVIINTDKKFQKITGFGGSFTEASAQVLLKLSPDKRQELIEAYFGDDGARYSLCRTHINSCDFSVSNYSYAPVENDLELKHFSIHEDLDDLIPMIKAAQASSSDGFKLIASPWTAPPWMKDNKDWRGGKLLPQYYPTWAKFFTKYVEAYQQQDIDIWGITVENEPLGNDNNWESMHFSAQEMTYFVQHYLGPELRATHPELKILGYDQNRGEELEKWVNSMFENKASAQYFDGTAVHWYASTYDVFETSLNYTHQKAPTKHLIQSEACIDAQIPVWKDDAWYWSKNATDWGWDWAPEDQKYLHPKYAPVTRYANDIIGCLNNWVDGWIDWNMVLNRQGGPNWAKNWCIAPVIVDETNNEIYYTPLYDVMTHFSKFIRPGAYRVEAINPLKNLSITAAINPDESIVIVVFNEFQEDQKLRLNLGNQAVNILSKGQSLQTIIIN
ncbi:MAG: glycoside hydrolase family 30 protein [Flavobacteriaceae bacterium]|nr:glycoside hydrolase family 30 protein [Flavobacteriaceae bacterium]